MTTYVTGIDGKVYRPRPWTTEERDHLFGRVHYLRHDEHMSIREIREAMLYDHNVRLSVGTICEWLKKVCEKCSGEHLATPEHLAGVGA